MSLALVSGPRWGGTAVAARGRRRCRRSGRSSGGGSSSNQLRPAVGSVNHRHGPAATLAVTLVK